MVDRTILGATSDEFTDMALNPAPAREEVDPTTIDDTAGAVPARVAQAATAGSIEQVRNAPELSFVDKAQAALSSTFTADIARQFMEPDDEDFDLLVNSDFKPENMVNDVVLQYGLPVEQDVFDALNKSYSADHMLYLAERMQQTQEQEQILADNPAFMVVGGFADPVMLAADIMSFGTTKALSMGRLASAITTATASTATLAALDAGTDAEVSGAAYAINAMSLAAVGALFGGRAGNRIDAGTGNWYGRQYTQGQQAANEYRKGLSKWTSVQDRLVHNEEARDVLAPVLDDPVRRDGWFTNNNAASTQRNLMNQFDGMYKEFEDAMDEAITNVAGGSRVRHILDVSGKYTRAREGIERQLQARLAERHEYFRRYGEVPQHFVQNDPLERLVATHEAYTNFVGNAAKRAGLKGFEDFTPTPGYFHRVWDQSKILTMQRETSQVFTQKLLARAIMRGGKAQGRAVSDLGLAEEEAAVIAQAILTRTRSKANDTRLEFFGAFGEANTEEFRQLLKESKTSQPIIDSIMRKVEQNVQEGAMSKYAKNRIDLDMTTTMVHNGRTYSVLDLIESDISRLAENYGHSMAGRSALAQAGYGGDDAGLSTLRTRYQNTLKDLGEAEREQLMEDFERVLGEFTGIQHASTKLSTNAQRLKAVVDMQMLAAGGLWQVAESATMAYTYGVLRSGKEMLRRFPGMRQLINQVGGDNDLYEEMATVLNMDLTRDIRIRAWNRQYDTHVLAADTRFDRLLYMGKQAVPYLNLMKFAHKWQTRVNSNLAANTLARAARGDKKARELLREFGMQDDQWTVVQRNIVNSAEFKGNNAQAMNWSAWDQEAVDAATATMTRMMDSAVLFGRTGQGAAASFLNNSSVGKILGQYRNFVSYAHNKQLRATLNHDGVTGLAGLMAMQYPLTFLMMSVNEARKGELDFDEDHMQEIAAKALTYTAAAGFMGDALSILGMGGRGGLAVPITSLANVPLSMVQAGSKMAAGDVEGGAVDLLKAGYKATPLLPLIPGTGTAIKLLEE